MSDALVNPIGMRPSFRFWCCEIEKKFVFVHYVQIAFIVFVFKFDLIFISAYINFKHLLRVGGSRDDLIDLNAWREEMQLIVHLATAHRGNSFRLDGR